MKRDLCWDIIFTVWTVVIALLFLMACYSIAWELARITPSKAQAILQSEVDQNPILDGTVRNVVLSSPICSSATGGFACRVDIQFCLGNQRSSGWCTYRIGQPQICGITSVISP
ncbi:hypothetical protein A2154_01040 [Candidatus Gottesmanbacteria bacterium RBG_16_43_7]|uniref:Uncharacterized protein n=1 Tax=Candidatus Gottesmanbacteria bacterium RBG_16_43_7 TaxID=1798373 RepID=A0A1F5Z7M3_9BACT|nr:MAG: hypothetical protein A2154_01040 [Candidatus Gottesmanbacteria bacterium RBG_16_43_7]